LKVEKIKVNSSVSERLDKYLPSIFHDYSRTFFQNLIKDGKVKLNGIIVSAKTRVVDGAEIEIIWPKERGFTIPAPEEFKFNILFEDDDLLVIDKPAGVVVHPAAGNWTGTVVNALVGRDSSFLDSVLEDEADELSSARPGIVHRLDKETSGCLVIAKNIKSRMKLAESFASRRIKKIYKAITYGLPPKNEEKITTLIGRHHINRQKMAVLKWNGKKAVTIYRLVKKWVYEEIDLSLLDVEILTGRTHQIRVHLAYKKCPILGDKLYGGKQSIKAPRQMLHAWYLGFPHPSTGKLIEIESPIPNDFKKYIKIIKPDIQEYCKQ